VPDNQPEHETAAEIRDSRRRLIFLTGVVTGASSFRRLDLAAGLICR